MYTEGLQIGDNSYLLYDDDTGLEVAKTIGTKEQVEEYLQVANQIEKNLTDAENLHVRLSLIKSKDKEAKNINTKTFLMTIILEGLLLGLNSISGSFQIGLLILAPTICISYGMISKIISCGTKKSRIEKKQKIVNEISKLLDDLPKLKNKRDTLEKQIEFSARGIFADKVVPVTTVENKKTNVKMRVLRLEQSR